MLGLHVVALDSVPPDDIKRETIRASGLALVAPGGPPLVLTTGEIGTVGDSGCVLRVAFARLGGGVLTFMAEHIATASIADAEASFSTLAIRGWRCGPTGASVGAQHRSSMRLQILRVIGFPADCESRLVPNTLAAWDANAEETWIGANIRVIAAPFGASDDVPVVHTMTSGVVSNISDPAGILLLDARCVDGFAGAGVVLEEPWLLDRSSAGHQASPARIVACVVPLLRSGSNETVVLNIAVPLEHIFNTLVDDPHCSKCLRVEELTALSAAPSRPSRASSVPRTLVSTPSTRLDVAARARCGVVLLWLESTGSWASAVVISDAGHLITCAHLLTGRSWMEIPPEEKTPPPSDSNSNSSTSQNAKPVTRPPPMPPKRCRGRGQTLSPQGHVQEVTFDADVLHIFDGFLDVALCLVRSVVVTSTKKESKHFKFAPLQWFNGPTLMEGTDVWAVGHGLFGPGTPWCGPAITCGQIAKVTLGAATQRPAVVQSSAAVHRGCSGGALVEASSSRLVGLVTTNVKHLDGAVMPHVNFSLPVQLLAPLNDFIAGYSAAGALRTLIEAMGRYAADEQEQALWRLEPEPLDLPSRVEDRKQQALDKMQALADEAAKEDEASRRGDGKQDDSKLEAAPTATTAQEGFCGCVDGPFVLRSSL